MSNPENDEGSAVYETGEPSKSQSSEQTRKTIASEGPNRKIRLPIKRTVTGWLRDTSTIGSGVDMTVLPPAIKPLGEKPTWNTLLTIDQARAIVAKVSDLDDQFFLVEVIPDTSGERRPLALCNSQKQTIAVPPSGTLLGSLVCELALLAIRTFEDARDVRTYERRRSALRKMALAAARGLAQ